MEKMSVGILTLGCKVNLYESEYVSGLLKDNGYEVKSFTEVCDIYIINTCTVTNTSDIKSRKMIRQARRRNKDACVVAMGCFIEANQNIKLPEVDIYIGTKNKSKIIEYIEEWFLKKEEKRKLSEECATVFEDMEITTFEGRTRAFVKIQDGCENFCSYCIIPYVRGKCRSKKVKTVLEEITRLVKNGYREIVLTGIHTGNYGVDIGTNFAKLLEQIIKIDGLERLRISSIEITELTEEVLTVLKKSSIIVDHLHIPLQAGSNEILTLMNRKYDKEYFLNKVNEIRKFRPLISITTDVIVGFPHENDALFQESIDFIKEIRFTKIHIFPYSIRTGTKAASMEEQISEEIKKERVKKLLVVSKELEEVYMKKFIGKTLKVLIETTNDNYSLGHTENYLLVKINDIYPREAMLDVEIIDIDYPYCLGVVKEAVFNA